MSGAGITRILRPEVKTSIDPSSLLARNTPNDAGLQELLDLVGEGLDLVALGAQSVGELLVLADGTLELLTRLDELLLHHGDLARGVRESTAQQADLLLQELHLALELVYLCVVPFDLLSVHHRCHLQRGKAVTPGPAFMSSIVGVSFLMIRKFSPNV